SAHRAELLRAQGRHYHPRLRSLAQPLQRTGARGDRTSVTEDDPCRTRETGGRNPAGDEGAGGNALVRLDTLPPSWHRTTLGEVAAPVSNAIVDGPFGSNLKLSDYVEEGIPVLQGKNITNDNFRWFDVRFISNRKASELKRSSVRVGDILIVKIGSIGYSAV